MTSTPSAGRAKTSRIDAVLIHAVYLINCASEDPEITRQVVGVR